MQAIVAPLIGTSGALVAAAIGAWAVTRSRKLKSSRLSIHDLEFKWLTSMNGSLFVSVDVSVFNEGERPSLITMMQMQCEENMIYRVLEPPSALYHRTRSALPRSSTFTAELPLPTSQPFTVDKKMSQLVPPNEFDKFQILISIPRHIDGPCIYQLRLLFHASQERRPVETERVVIFNSSGPKFKGQLPVRKEIERFSAEVLKVRGAYDLASHRSGLARIDWDRAGRDQEYRVRLQDNLAKETRTTIPDGVDILGSFWSPREAVEEFFQKTIAQQDHLRRVLGDVQRWEMLREEDRPDPKRLERVVREMRELQLQTRSDLAFELSERQS